MKVIGLTGGIGTGKSTATAFLRERNYPVLDADQMAREMTGLAGVLFRKFAGYSEMKFLTTAR